MIFDIFAGILIIFSVFDGLKKGAINTIFDLTKILASIILVPKFLPYTNSILSRYNLHIILIYIITFFIILIILSAVAYLIKSIVNIVNIGILDKLLGAVIGLLQAIVILLVLLVSMLYAQDYIDGVKANLETSYTAYYLSLGTRQFNNLFPENIKEKLEDFYFKNKKIELTNEILKTIKKESVDETD